MFYQTVLKSVKDGIAVDVQGKQLRFIGYLPVQEGDSVWTDGTVIFGNVPPKSLPNVDSPNEGVPVLCEFNDNPNFTGYVTKTGTIKRKSIAVDGWIINDDKNFAHGETKIDGQKVIEAAIFRTEDQSRYDLYAVTEGLYQKNQCVKYRNHLYVRFHYSQAAYIGRTQYNVFAKCYVYEGEEIKLGVDSADENQPVKIYKNDEMIEEIDLQPYADFISEKCWAVEDEIKALSQNNNANYMLQPDPPDSFIGSVYVRPVSMRINKTGDWDAIIFASAKGYCFPYMLLNGSVFEPIFNKENGSVKTFSAKLAKSLINLEKSIFTNNNFPFLQIEKYPDFNDVIIPFSGELENCLDRLERNLPETASRYPPWPESVHKTDPETGNYTEQYRRYLVAKAEYYLRNQPALSDEVNLADKCTAEYKAYVEEKLEYYIPLVRFKFTEWMPVTFGGSCLLRVHNGEIINVMRQHVGGGGEVLAEYEWNETKGTYYTLHNFKVPNKTENNKWDYPLNDGFFLSGEGAQIKEIRDSKNAKILDLSELNVNVGQKLEVMYPLHAYWDHKDTQVDILATEEIPAEAFGHSYISLPVSSYMIINKDGMSFKSYDNYSTNRFDKNGAFNFDSNFFETISHNLRSKENYFLMDGFFDSESEDGFFRFNPFVCKLNSTNYLLGIHEGELFVKKTESHESIANNLKNFRLCEMENLSKAK